jgi:hypothetical protein
MHECNIVTVQVLLHFATLSWLGALLGTFHVIGGVEEVAVRIICLAVELADHHQRRTD